MSAARRCRASHGQGLVEFALVIPVFFLMLFGVIDGARLVYMNSVVSQAAREGARLAAVEASWLGSTDPTCGTAMGPVCPPDLNTLRAHVAAAANRMVTPFGPIATTDVFLRCDTPGGAPTGAWTGATCTNKTTNNVVSVRVQLDYAPITPLLGMFTGPLSGSATMANN